MGCCTGCGRVCSGGICRNGSGRGRGSISGIVAGQRMEHGRCCCRRFRPPRTPRAGLTGTCRWTQLRCGPTSMPPARGKHARPRFLKRGSAGGRTRLIRRFGNWSSDWRRWSDRRVPGTLPRRLHHQNPPRRRRTMPAPRLPADPRTLRRRPPTPPRPGADVRAPYRRGPASHPARSCAGRQGLHARENRRYLRRRGISHTIPERLDQRRHRHNRGSRGGRPTGFDREHYKKGNTVERAINRLKGFRAIATRYEKRAYTYLGTMPYQCSRPLRSLPKQAPPPHRHPFLLRAGAACSAGDGATTTRKSLSHADGSPAPAMTACRTHIGLRAGGLDAARGA